MTSSLEAFRQELEDQDIEVIEHKCVRSIQDTCTTCILGVLLSDNGKEIEQYMLSWLTKKYNVISIRQPLPGALFEYPALRFAQLFSIEHNVPVLYMHTKGAAHKGKLQCKTINMWKREFVCHKSAYEKNMDRYDVLLPYSGPQNITWLNGFIASAKAFSTIAPIPVFENRYYYEILFKGTALNFYGRRLSNLLRTDEMDNTNQMYLDLHQFSASFFSFTLFFHRFK